MYQDAALRNVESPARLRKLALYHLGDQKGELRVGGDCKVVADGRDSNVRGHEREMLLHRPLHSVPDGAEKWVGANREVKRSDRIPLLDSCGAHTCKMSMPQKRRFSAVSPYIVT